MRQSIAKDYNTLFKDVKGVIIPIRRDDREHIYHVYALRVRNRDKIIEDLKAGGVSALIHYPIPLHLQKAYEGLGYHQGDFPVSERTAEEIISLPMFPHIKLSQIKYISGIIKEAAG